MFSDPTLPLAGVVGTDCVLAIMLSLCGLTGGVGTDWGAALAGDLSSWWEQ
jgi:hypothetical protein